MKNENPRLLPTSQKIKTIFDFFLINVRFFIPPPGAQSVFRRRKAEDRLRFGLQSRHRRRPAREAREVQEVEGQLLQTTRRRGLGPRARRKGRDWR